MKKLTRPAFFAYLNFQYWLAWVSYVDYVRRQLATIWQNALGVLHKQDLSPNNATPPSTGTTQRNIEL